MMFEQRGVNRIPGEDGRKGFQNSRIGLQAGDGERGNMLRWAEGTRNDGIPDPKIHHSEVAKLDGNAGQVVSGFVSTADKALDRTIERLGDLQELVEGRAPAPGFEVRNLGLE